MDNQHQKIQGYRDLSQNEIDLMNGIKEAGQALGILVEELQSIPEIDRYWLNIGAQDLKTGIMALVRAIAKPESF